MTKEHESHAPDVAAGLVAALRTQRQIDNGGSLVAVSRQAVDEAADMLDKHSELAAARIYESCARIAERHPFSPCVGAAIAAKIRSAPQPPANIQKEVDRDWELKCEACDGTGHIDVEHQVAERQTDVQTFREVCECCDGRGFMFAYNDIPGIESYARGSIRPASAQPSVPDDGDSICVWSVWFRHNKAKYTTERQAALAAWNEAIRWRASVSPPPDGQAQQKSIIQRLERTLAGHQIGHDQSDGGEGFIKGFAECTRILREIYEGKGHA